MKLKKTADKSDILVQKVPVFEADAAQGLSGNQAALRAQSGLCNTPVDSVSKTTKQIILSNVFTYFNMIFCAIALVLIFEGCFKDLSFMAVVVANTAIGIVQELNAKKTLDKLSLMSEPTAIVIRDGVEKRVNIEELVKDDIIILLYFKAIVS